MNKRTHIWGLLITLMIVAPSGAYTFNASDFATAVTRYTPGTGTGAYTDPTTALGRPTVDSLGDGLAISPIQPVPIVPVYPAWRTDELVTVGGGGELILQFDHVVTNDPDNPWGLDLILYGNSIQQFGGGVFWQNGDPSATLVGGLAFEEAGRVSVSLGYQGLTGEVINDPDTWQRHVFGSGPYADTYAPTLGRVYDPASPHQPDAGWSWNQWWGQPTDPTLPVNPAATPADHAGQSVLQMIQTYDHPIAGATSAGGTGFDLDWLTTPIDGFQYVRIEDLNPNDDIRTEVDAVADVAAVTGWAAGDLNRDLFEDVTDIDLMIANLTGPGIAGAQQRFDFDSDGDADMDDVALMLTQAHDTHIGDANLDGVVDEIDLGLISSNWRTPTVGGWGVGDIDGSGVIDGIDLWWVSRHWLQSGAGTTSVPEPGAAGMLCVAGAILSRRRRQGASR